jgi:hypothetical protein
MPSAEPHEVLDDRILLSGDPAGYSCYPTRPNRAILPKNLVGVSGHYGVLAAGARERDDPGAGTERRGSPL